MVKGVPPPLPVSVLWVFRWDCSFNGQTVNSLETCFYFYSIYSWCSKTSTAVLITIEISEKQAVPIKLDSTKVQTLGAISESINETRHCTTASYTIRWDTGPRGVYLSTEPVSRRLAASAGKPDCTSRCAGQLSGQKQVKEASDGQRYTGSG